MGRPVKHYLLDSNIVIEFLKGNSKIRDTLLKLISKGVLAVSPVVLAEVYTGIRKGEEETTRDVFEIMECLDINEEIGINAGKYLKQFRKTHGMESGDALIAATAAYYKAELLTLNKKYYPMKDVSFYTATA